MVFPSGLRQIHLFWNLFYFNIVHYHQLCHLNMFRQLYYYFQKSNKTQITVRFSKFRIKSIFMLFPLGLRQTQLFGSYFSSTLFINIIGVICFESYMITIKKVTRLRVRISKSTKKSILMVFPFGLRQTRLFWIYFTSTLFITINRAISICFDNYFITTKKLTRLRLE